MIYKTPGITRAELSEALDVNKSVTTNITSFLERTGWIDVGESRGKNVPLAIRPSRLNVAGVIVQPEFCSLVICDLAGAVLHAETWSERSADLETVLNVVIPYRLHQAALPVGALGVALPGVVDEKTGTLFASIPLGIDGPKPLPDRIGAGNFPVFYENDARCIGWGLIGLAREKSDFFLHYLSFIETDPPSESFARIIHGSALFIGGRAYSGASHCAGELRIKSHLAFAGSGEAYLDHDTRMKMKSDGRTMDTYLDGLAFNIAYVATLMDVPKVFLYGSLESRGPGFGEKIASLAQRISYYPGLQRVTVEFPGFSDRTIPLGAVGMATERLFSVPVAERPGDFYREIIEGKR